MKTIVTEYKFPQRIYFEKILRRVCFHVLASDIVNPKIIDYGCGQSVLESLLIKQDPSISIAGYDTRASLSKISSPFLAPYDIWVFNHVLVYMSNKEIEELFRKIKELKVQMCRLEKVVLGMIGMVVLGMGTIIIELFGRI